MAKLILSMDGLVLKEIPLNKERLSIGRKPHNDIQIDNLAISGQALAEARTVAVNVFVMVEAAYLFNCRSLTQGFWKQGLFSNLWLWAGVGSMMLLQLAMTYLPVMNQLFGTAPIGLAEWLEITLVALFSSSVIALEKWLSNARRKL